MYRPQRFGSLANVSLALFLATSCRAATTRRVSTPPIAALPHVLLSRNLGRCNGYAIRCKLLFSQVNNTYTAKFIARDRKGNAKIFLQSLGKGWEGTGYWSLDMGDYIGTGHKQVFVSARIRARNMMVLDCDGNRLRVLYHREDMFASDILRTRHGRWLVEELCREDCLHKAGTVYEIVDEWKYEPHTQEESEEHSREEREEPGLTERPRQSVSPWETEHGVLLAYHVLQWDGKAFVPEKPGATKILRVTNAKYCRQHDLPLEPMCPVSGSAYDAQKTEPQTVIPFFRNTTSFLGSPKNDYLSGN